MERVAQSTIATLAHLRLRATGNVSPIDYMAEWIFAVYLKAKKFLWLVPIRTGEYAVPYL
jgi:hypothetical protein